MDSNRKSTTWPADQLAKIAGADDLKVSPLREDGVSYGTPTWIWNVAVAGQLYVRPYNGTKSRWYQAAITQKSGRIHAAGMVVDVLFDPVVGNVNSQIDDAYRTKYKGSPYLDHMVGKNARSATISISPGGDSKLDNKLKNQ